MKFVVDIEIDNEKFVLTLDQFTLFQNTLKGLDKKVGTNEELKDIVKSILDVK